MNAQLQVLRGEGRCVVLGVACGYLLATQEELAEGCGAAWPAGSLADQKLLHPP